MIQRYKKYKNSGVSWVEQIPEHWNIIPFKSLFTTSKGLNITKNDLKDFGIPVISYGQIHSKDNKEVGINETLFRYVSESYLQEGNNSLVNKGDFIFADTSEDIEGCGNFIYIDTQTNLFAGYHSIIVRNKKKDYSKYFAYLFKSIRWRQQIQISVTGIKVFSITKRILTSTDLLIPPESEQQSIVLFLDRKCSQIDTYISKKEREIELLKEWLLSKIANVVTKGLDHNITMKESGISWIGKVPKHWEIKSLRNFIKLVSIKNHGDEQLLSVTREKGVIIRDTSSKEENHNFIPEDLSGYKFVVKGQFVINKMKSWQGSYGVSQFTGIVSPAYYVCDLRFPYKEFFSIAIRSKVYIPFFTQYSKGIRVDQWDLSPIALKTIPFVMPSIEEQKAIVDHINKKKAKVDKMISSIQAEIYHLKEYKQSLISDVVTGKIKVCQ